MLVDRRGRYVWGCLPHFAADPSFCDLLQPTTEGQGFCSVELEGFVSSEQHYLPNTAVLVTTLDAEDGSSVEITDFSPRFRRWDRLYHPVMFVRRIRPLAGVHRVIRSGCVRSPTGAHGCRTGPAAATTSAGCCRTPRCG